MAKFYKNYNILIRLTLIGTIMEMMKEKAFTGEAVYFIYSRKSSYQSIKDILVWFYGSRENSNRDVLLAAIEKKY